MNDMLRRQMIHHWKDLRGRTYDYMNELTENDLWKKLPFERSQDIAYQFWCMTGAQESMLALIEDGIWKGFSCSLDALPEKEFTMENIRDHMNKADSKLLQLLNDTDNLLREFADGSTPLSHYMALVEHESHHQGQLINFIYACDLPIPKSWHGKWALTRD